MFFFFFFNELYNIPTIKLAFKKTCQEKLLFDGYYDMSRYINGTITDEEMRYLLAIEKSPFIKLYQQAYPTKENAYHVWETMFSVSESNVHLSISECEAIIYWVYMIMQDQAERIELTKKIFNEEKELHEISSAIEEQDGVFYNAKTIELRFVDSIAKFNDAVTKYTKKDERIFYRGHSDANYLLQASIFRKQEWEMNERVMYNQLLIDCPDYFMNLSTHLEKLVEMQHYGLPTRLLDITQNPLVALYFACESRPDRFGEIVLISAKNDQIKYPQSDTATILSSLPALSYSEQQEYYRYANDKTISDDEFNKKIGKLLHEIKLEKPAFLSKVKKESLVEDIIVVPLKNNRRIVKQDGAFILCGLSRDQNTLNSFRVKTKEKTAILIVRQKDKLLHQLASFSINRAKLFPEIDSVADYIKKTYQ